MEFPSMNLRKSVMIILASILTASPVAAWDGIATGKISEIHTLTESNNYEFRVRIAGVTTVCNHPNPDAVGWAYMNSADTNYKAVVANLMSAHALGRTVTIFTMNDGGAGCHIHYVVVNS